MKRTSPFLERGAAVDMDAAMTPMIDVVFLLLVFFVWTASFVAVEQILPSELSSQLGKQAADVLPPAEQQDLDNVVVRIRLNDLKQPAWTINDQPYPSIEAIRRQLQAIAKAAASAPVILHPQSTVPLGPVIQTYDVAKQCGFDKVSFAVNAVR